VSFCTGVGCTSCCPYQLFQQSNRRFEQKTDRFWKFSEEADRWIEVQLPCDLISGGDGECGKVNRREESMDQEQGFDDREKRLDRKDDKVRVVGPFDVGLMPLRKRVSLTKMSETSVWITGESGSIYERFWNGLEWVMAPHDLPISAGRAVAVFIISHMILALSESGNLYQVIYTSSQNYISFRIPTLLFRYILSTTCIYIVNLACNSYDLILHLNQSLLY